MELLNLIFEKAGCTTVSDQSPSGIQLELCYIANPDGSPRWVWPVSNTKPLFLKFYNATTKRSLLLTFLIQTAFLLRLQKWVFRKTKIKIAHDVVSAFSLHAPWALFTGTIGPNQKAVVYTEGSFLKIPLGKTAGELLQNEKLALHQLAMTSDGIHAFTFPKRFTSAQGTLNVSDVKANGQRSAVLTPLHITALTELREISGKTFALTQLPIWKQTKKDLDALNVSADPRLPKGLLRKLAQLVEGIDPSLQVETSFSHGDFTPWNMYKTESKLHVYDWELSNPMMPVGFDAFHFIIQQGILVDRFNWKQIEAKIHCTITDEVFVNLSGSSKNTVADYLKLYLIINSVYYLKTYSRQELWHTQVSWLLQTWNEAVSSMMIKIQSPRKLVLMDVFDFLADKKYAALKFTDKLPEYVDEFSDVDLCMDQATQKALACYLSNHVLVRHVLHSRKSFMHTTQLFFADGSLLSLDMIWTIKRKQLVMMDAEKLLKNAYSNDAGIKVPQVLDNARYIGLFYAMNHANVPVKYKAYGQLFSSPSNTLDDLLYAYFLGATHNTRICIEHAVKKLEVNTGLAGLKHTFKYMLDTFKELFFTTGMTITFSGVDGAGKSTVIENVKTIFDKKLRKKVVVIRHRPSLLPILSAITKGKVAAEQAAASGLPRQGNNTNRLSSLLRFAYYYTDYLFGQFYVYFRYVKRGYVVLYDRYYFDFINDPRRSNIQLPSWFTKLGYFFLLKPDMNFFLYADAELIRARKQELSVETISELTHQYKTLFNQLDAGNKSKRYLPIENINLNQTLETIMNLVKLKAA
jgi:thymidylate kinase